MGSAFCPIYGEKPNKLTYNMKVITVKKKFIVSHD